MDGMEALDASAARYGALVARVRPEQWDDPTPCAGWDVRTLVGHLIVGRHVYCGILRGVPATELRSIMARQAEAAGADPLAASADAARSVHEAFSEPGAMERTVRHPSMGEMPASRLLVQLVSDIVLHSWDLAIAIGADPGLDDQLVELAYAFYSTPPLAGDDLYATGFFTRPTRPLPPATTPLDRLLHRAGR
jgi:uncharacterized protein (TIGR03086 family)